jgi:hypothetical protein
MWVGLVLVIAMAGVAHATVVTTGSSVVPSSGGSVGGTLLGSLTTTFDAPGYFTGTLDSLAYADDPFNPFTGGMTFVYQVHNDPGSDELHHLVLDGWGGLNVDVVTVSTLDAAISAVGRAVDSELVFDFAIGAGAQSQAIVVHADCDPHTWRDDRGRVRSAVQQGSLAETEALGPLPEPTTGAMMMLVGVALLLRR